MHFYKFDGAGNDFVLVDIRDNDPQLSTQQIAQICHRRFGVGADGLMTLGLKEGYDFEMRYYNSDGRLGSMCGNGGRCITAFAHYLGIKPSGECYRFIGYDGPHDGQMLAWNTDARIGIVQLGMHDIQASDIQRLREDGLDGYFLDTGSPHYVQRVEGLMEYDVVGEGRRIRNMSQYFPQGTNVDFIEDLPDGTLFVRTYERGVEDETWACGTGVTACSIVSGNQRLKTKGGDFKVTFSPTGKAYTDVKLIGPVALNFEGDILL